jgi:hypothetical protein
MGSRKLWLQSAVHMVCREQKADMVESKIPNYYWVELNRGYKALK